ncbi:MAG: hypothetical protein EOP06_24000, partial [Proteobacteria bacterium]
MTAEPPPAQNPGEQGGDARPTPTPSPTPGSGQPGNPGNGKPGDPGAGNPKPTPAPVKERVARIYCADSPQSTFMPTTMRADVVPNYVAPGLRFFTPEGKRAAQVKNLVPLRSDGLDSYSIIRAIVNVGEPFLIYKAKSDLLKQDGSIELLSSFSDEPNKFAYQLLDPSIQPAYISLIGANQSRTAFVYPNRSGSYVIQSFGSSSSTEIKISARNSSNPRFVRDEWIAFDQASGSVLTQKFYNVKTKSVVSLPSPSSSRNYQLYGFVSESGNLYWVEGPAGGPWKLKSYNKSRTVDFGQVPGVQADINLPFAIYEDGGSVRVGYVEEGIVLDEKGNYFAKSAALRVLTVSNSASGKFSDTKAIDYSETMKSTITLPKPGKTILNFLFFEPLSKRLYASYI